MTRNMRIERFITDWHPDLRGIGELRDLAEAAYSDGLADGREEMRAEILSAIDELAR